MRRPLTIALGLLVASCYQDHGVIGDAGPRPIDGGEDAAPLLPCEPAGTLEPVARLHREPRPASRPYAGIRRVLADEAADRWVVALEDVALGSLGDVTELSLLIVERDGRIDRTVRIDGGRPFYDLSLDVVAVANGWMVVGADRVSGDREEWTEVWVAHVRREDGPVLREVVSREEAFALGRLTAVPRVDGAIDVYSVRDGALFHQVLRDREISVPEAMEVTFEPEADYHEMIATRADATTCIVARASTGRGWVVRLRDSVLESNSMFAARGLATVPIAEPLPDECALAYFEPHLHLPTQGRLRLVGLDGGAIGWGGTHPLGVTLLPGGGRVALAVPSPLFPDRVDVHTIELDESLCRTAAPAMIRTTASQPAPLGALVSGGLHDEVFVFEMGLDGPGVLTALRFRAP